MAKKSIDWYERVMWNYEGRRKAIMEVYYDDTLDDEKKKEMLEGDYEEVKRIESELGDISERDEPYRGTDINKLARERRYMSLIIPGIIEMYTREFNEPWCQLAVIEALRKMGYQGDYGNLASTKDAMDQILAIRSGEMEKIHTEEIAALKAKHEEEMKKIGETHEKEIKTLEAKHEKEMEGFKKEVMDRVDKWMKAVMEIVKGIPVIGKTAAKRVEKRAKGLPTPKDR